MKSNKKKSYFQHWDSFEKFAFSWALGFTALCGVMAGLDYKYNNKKGAIIQSSLTAVNALCATKIMCDTRKRTTQKEQR